MTENKPKSLTQEQIDELIQKHKLFHYTVGDKQGWFRNPSIKILTAAQAQKDSTQYYYTLARNCFIAGDPELIDNEDYFIPLMKKLDELTNYFNVEVKKL
ncbi:MAG: hypothetical protein LCH37_12965 [Bacteroidetes bacterium]|nr:hypothetical protein [Bacteroidota bacterium]